MKNEITFIYKENVLSSLAHDFERDRPLKMTQIDTLQQSLANDEISSSADTLAIMKMRSLLSEGDSYQAYKTINSAIQLDPLNLSLQLEYYVALNSLADRFKTLIADSPNNPLIEVYYNILYHEAFLNSHLQSFYLNYLINEGQNAQALQLAIPLIELFPAMLGLRDTVEKLVLVIPDPRLMNYLRTPPYRIRRQVITSKRTAAEVLKLKKTFQNLLDKIHSPEPDPVVAKTLNEILGEVTETSPIDTSIKDIYYLKALYEGNIGNHWTAIELLQNLVEIDQCNLYFRRSLAVEVQKFCSQKDLDTDPRSAYAVLREFSVVPYVMIKQVALAHIKNNSISEAKKLMTALVELNSYDNDYLIATLEVAIESKDQDWISEIYTHIVDIIKSRPWDLALRAAIEENVMP